MNLEIKEVVGKVMKLVNFISTNHKCFNFHTSIQCSLSVQK